MDLVIICLISLIAIGGKNKKGNFDTEILLFSHPFSSCVEYCALNS